MTQDSAATQRARLASLFDSLAPSVLVAVLRPNGTLVHANRAALDLMSADLNDVAGTPVEELACWRDSEASREALSKALAAGRQRKSSSFALATRTRHGSTLTIDFTMRFVARSDQASPIFILSGCEVSERRPHAGPARERHILLVDDDAQAVARMSQQLLAHFGTALKVTPCTDPLQALQVLRGAPVDVLLSDLRMPGMDGLTLLGLARQLQPQAVRIMLVRPNDMERVVNDQRQIDVFRYLSKPCQAEPLCAHVQAALDPARPADAEQPRPAVDPRAQTARGAAPAAIQFERVRPAVAAASVSSVAAAVTSAVAATTAADIEPTDDEMVLPTQLPTMPGDLWAVSGSPTLTFANVAR